MKNMPIPEGYILYDCIYTVSFKCQMIELEHRLEISGYRSVSIGGLEGLRSLKDHGRYPCGIGNVLYLACIDINTQVVKLYYSFAKKLPLGETGHKGSLSHFF